MPKEVLHWLYGLFGEIIYVETGTQTHYSPAASSRIVWLSSSDRSVSQTHVAKRNVLIPLECLRDEIPRRTLLLSSASSFRCYPTDKESTVTVNGILNRSVKTFLAREFRRTVPETIRINGSRTAKQQRYCGNQESTKPCHGVCSFVACRQGCELKKQKTTQVPMPLGGFVSLRTELPPSRARRRTDA